jgi:NADH:ubiquinone oxidoreductase subunit 6 (subunit J)
MSAPQTNLEKQERRHWGPLTGMAIGLAFVAALFIGYLVWTTANGDVPREATPEGGVIGNEPTQDLVAPVETVVPGATVPDVQN